MAVEHYAMGFEECPAGEQNDYGPATSTYIKDEGQAACIVTRLQPSLIEPWVVIEILDEDANLVKRLYNAPRKGHTEGNVYVDCWDGTNEAKEKVASGRYYVRYLVMSRDDQTCGDILYRQIEPLSKGGHYCGGPIPFNHGIFQECVKDTLDDMLKGKE